MAGPDDAPAVEVTYRGRSWQVQPGGTLSIGRSPTCQLRLPDDDFLSRHAGSLRPLEDCVLIRNDSGSKPLIVRPPAGEDRVVEPGAAITSLPYRQFTVVFAGRYGAVSTVGVDATALGGHGSTPGSPTAATPETVTAPLQLTAAQSRVLTALCAPLLTGTGPAVAPATYVAIGEQLGLAPHYVRNAPKAVREALTGYGVPGLTPGEAAGPAEDFRWPLARWAIRGGWVNEHDIERLGAGSL